MIEIVNKQDCVGCRTCSLVCPKQCIAMKQDEEGFFYPEIDSDSCINCGRCDSVCPVLNVFVEQKKEHQWLGAYHKHVQKQLESSSGGVFYELSKYILDHNGIVWGAAWTQKYKVGHIYVETLDDLPKLQKSKYVQSDLGDAFKIIRKQLKDDRLVLFSGTPCQVKALNLYLKRVPKNLMTVEVICHGVPSPKVFESYMAASNFSSIDFRSKERGWYNYDVRLISQKGKEKKMRAVKNLYMKGFIHDVYNRPSCTQCPAKSFQSNADCTLGDFWGVEIFVPALYNNKGTSLIGLHSLKAQHIWKQIRQNFIYQPVNYEQAIQFNPSLIESSKASASRNAFFEDFKQNGILKALDKHVKEPCSIKKEMKKFLLFIWNTLWAVAIVFREYLYQIKDTCYRITHKRPIVRNVEDSLQYILSNHCSVSRYGDGELKFIEGSETWFQKKDVQLQRKLRIILQNQQTSNLIVCIPSIFSELNQYRDHDKHYWKKHIARTRKTWYTYLNRNTIYYDAFISRCYMPYKDKTKVKRYFDLWKEIWKDKNLLIIEGEKTRLGVGNDLFSGTRSIKRILCPNTQAFSYYDLLLNETLKYSTDHLVLIAVGPSATVLAADLADKGYQAIDVGHVDIEYEWYLMHADNKLPVDNKFVNEAGAGVGVGDINDKQYKSEIVCQF